MPERRLHAAEIDPTPWPSLTEAVQEARSLERAGWRVRLYDPTRPETHPRRGDGSRVAARVVDPQGGGAVGDVTYWPPTPAESPGHDPGA